MHRLPASLSCLLLLLIGAPCVEAVATYTCTVVQVDVGDPSATGSLIFPTSINNEKDVGGVWFGMGLTGFAVDQTGASLPYTHPPGSNVNQAAVNNRGQVAGWFGAGPYAVTPAQSFISNPDGTLIVLEPPEDTPTQSFGDMWVYSINDNGDVLGQIGVTDQNGQQTTYWFIRDAGDNYTMFDQDILSAGRVFVSHQVGPVGSLNNSGTAVLGDRIRFADGSERPVAPHFDLPFAYWYGINNKGVVVGNFIKSFSVTAKPDGHAPAISCPQGYGVVAYGINDDGVVTGYGQVAGLKPAISFATPTGFQSGLELSNQSWGFSPSPVRQQGGTGTIYLKSTGKADLYIATIVISSTNPGNTSPDFFVTDSTCNYAGVTPGDVCSVSFTFNPSGVGARTADLVIYDDAPDAPHVIRLDGTGLGKQAPVVSNNSWTFGSLPLGSSASGIVYIYNPGTDPINVSSIAISGTNASDFQITENTCGTIFAPYKTCAVSFQFAPTAVGRRVAGLTLADDSPLTPQTIPLQGYGY